MQLYYGTSKDFITDVAHNAIAKKLSDAFKIYFREEPQPNEVNSWRNSLKAVSLIFQEANLMDHGILLEYQLPLTSKRLDCLISGKDKKGNSKAVIIELKQWQETKVSDGENEVVTWLDGVHRDILHPSAQVGNYRSYLKETHSAFTQHDIDLHSVSLLHNYHYQEDDPILADKFKDLLDDSPLFTAEDNDSLKDYLVEKLGAGEGMSVLEKIATGKFAPSKKLLNELKNVIHNKTKFILIDEQQIVFDKVYAILKKAKESKDKTAIIIKGGPGTGKSVIAINLLFALFQDDYKVNYATGSKAFTETLRNECGPSFKMLFKYFNGYKKRQKNEIDVLICDEAHRIRENSNDYFTKVEERSKLPQLYELLKVAKITLFFIDDFQIVRPEEIGSIDFIRTYAKSKNVNVIDFALEAQFRCNGSDAFINFLDDALGIRRTANNIWDNNEAFDFQIMDTVEDLEAAIRQKDKEGFNARIAAGFCWPWAKETDKEGNLINDVKIGDWIRPWNAHFKIKKLAEGIPNSSLWATHPGGINQIGCVYTAQGFEYDYAGIIVGPDLIYSFDKRDWIGQPQHSHDYLVARDKKNFVNYVKNTYKVLMTRGMKGCYVHFTDDDTAKYFKSRCES